MVRIINYKERQADDKTFYVLEVQGGIQMVKSKTTNQFYATAKKAYIATTFDEKTCIALIGTEMDGCVIKQPCEPFEYTVRETGEVITLTERYVYSEVDTDAKEDEAIQKLISETPAVEELVM